MFVSFVLTGGQVKMDKATALVLISYESKEFPTYLIENRSSFSFTFFQKGTKVYPASLFVSFLPGNYLNPSLGIGGVRTARRSPHFRLGRAVCPSLLRIIFTAFFCREAVGNLKISVI
jgi:hypothetical protein